MSSYIITPMKHLSIAIDGAASQSGTERKVEFNFTPVDLRHRVKQRRKDPLKMPENVDPNVISSRYLSITEAIQYKYEKIVLVWCPSSVVTGDFLAPLVYKYGMVIDLRDRWLPATSCDNKMVWGGMTVFYKKKKNAITAENDLPLQSKYIRTISMCKIITDIAIIEVTHPKYGTDYTKVIIRSNNIMKEKKRGGLEHLLRQCGEVLSLKYKEKVCKVKYRYFTHAHLASVVLNDGELKYLGKLTATVERSEKEEEILDLLKENVMLHIEDCFFTR